MIPLRLAVLATALTVTLFAAPVRADAPCTAEIRALFDGGGLDPFSRPPFRQVLVVTGEDGAEKYTMDSIAVTPLHQISGIRGGGQFILMVDRKTWMGPSMEGPWTDAGTMMTEDMVAAQRAVAPSMAANVSEADCKGRVETDNGPRLLYQFRTKVDPHPARGDSWWGGYYRMWLDPETRLPMEWETTEHVSSWYEGVKKETHTATMTYDDSIEIARPE